MTVRKHLKQLVRTRMQKTGESYAAARRMLTRDAAADTKNPRQKAHRPGSIPAVTALRALLTHHGLLDPTTKKAFTEATLFGLAGGIGMGVFQFFYEKEDFASFFIAGRHDWWDDVAFFDKALKRLGQKPTIKEAGGEKAALKYLTDLLQTGPVIAWVDAASLPHRAMPKHFQGGGYHVIVIYEVDEAAGTATVGDLTDEPITITLKDLAAARGRIKKFKNRLLGLTEAKPLPDLKAALRDGLAACHVGLVKQRMKNFTLAGLLEWGHRLAGSKDKEGWERVFPPGHRLWQGLCSIHEYIEHYGTGGGLCRPLFAEFLAQAGKVLADDDLEVLSQRYTALGEEWSQLAEAALPNEVPLCKSAKALHVTKAELTAAGAPPEEVGAAWKQLAELTHTAKAAFPFTAEATEQLRLHLQSRVLHLHDVEQSAHDGLGAWLRQKPSL